MHVRTHRDPAHRSPQAQPRTSSRGLSHDHPALANRPGTPSGDPFPLFSLEGRRGPCKALAPKERAPSLRSRTPVRLRAGLSCGALGKGRATERYATGTLGGRGSRRRPPTLRAGCGRPGEAPRPGEGRPHREPEPPGSADAQEQRQEPGAQGAGSRGRGDGSGGGGRGSRSRAALRTHLGSGRPRGARASCRSLGPSCPSPCLCLLCARTSRPRNARSARTAAGEGDAPQVWSEGLDRVWEKFVPRGRERAAGLRHWRGAGASPVACGERRGRGVRSGPPGAGARSFSRSPSLSGLLLSPGEVLGSRRAGARRCRLRRWRPSGALAARGGRGVHRPARAPIAQAAAAAPLLPSARARSSDKFWGTPRRLFFNCPTATHLPPAGWRLAPPSPPPLASPPPCSPPHPHPEARTRHREEPGLGAPGSSPFPSPSLAGRGAAARGAAAGKPRQGSLEAARRRRRRGRGKPTGRPREIQRPRKGPRGLLALLRCRAAPEVCSVPSSAERRWRESLELFTPAPGPNSGSGTLGKENLCLFSRRVWGSFLSYCSESPTHE